MKNKLKIKYLFKNGKDSFIEKSSDELPEDKTGTVYDDGLNCNNPFAATIHFSDGSSITTNRPVEIRTYEEIE